MGKVVLVIVAIDSETCPITPENPCPPLVLVSRCDDVTLEPTIHHVNDDAYEIIRDSFSQHNVVGQNICYDVAVFITRYPDLAPTIFQAYGEDRVADSMCCERMLDITRGYVDKYFTGDGTRVDLYYNLSSLSERYGFGKMEKDLYRMRYGEWLHSPKDMPDGAIEYAKLDALRTLQIFLKQREHGSLLGDDACAQARTALALHLMSCHGMITEMKACLGFVASTKAEIEQARLDLIEAGLLTPGGKRDTKKAKLRMVGVCAELEITTPMTKPPKHAKATWRPGVCLNQEATAITGDKLLQQYSLYSSAKTAINRAERLMEGAKGTPLRTRFKSPMVTGRISSGKDEEGAADNFTNLPRKPGLRECFVSRPGHVFCSVDLEQAELVGVSEIHMRRFGRSTLGKAIIEGKDIHCVLAAEMLRCSYDEMLANKKTGKYAKARQEAKYGNFGYWGGMGPKRHADQVNKDIPNRADKITEKDSARIREGWRAAWAPESYDYFTWINEIIENGGTIKQFVSGRIRGRCSYTEAANTFFQGLVADGILEAAWNISQEMYLDRFSPMYGSRLVLCLHDELFAELPEDRAHEAAMRMTEVLLNTFNNKYTTHIPMRAEPCLMRRWRKATPSLYSMGELVPAKPQLNGQDVLVATEGCIWVPDL